MSISSNQRNWPRAALVLPALALAGCNAIGTAAADLGLAGAGGVAGYQVSDNKIGGAAAGAALGYLASRVTQGEVQRAISDAEKRGFERAMNQAVKQQYWLIQAQQHSRHQVDAHDVRLVPIVMPEGKINGVLQNAHIEYLRVEQ